MKPILDKDLDTLIKQRFENFETEPPAELWSKIDTSLTGSKTRNKIKSFYWVSAASIVIIFSAALYFYKPLEVIKLRAKNESREILVNKPDPAKEFKEVKNIQAEKIKVLTKNTLPNTNQTVYKIPANNSGSEIKENRNLKRPEVSEVLIADNQEKFKNTIPLIADSNTAEPVLLVSQPLETVTEIAADIPKQKIKSVGSLINFVISRVDKREDKIIEFKDGKEGSAVSVINLGLIKFKSRNK